MKLAVLLALGLAAPALAVWQQRFSHGAPDAPMQAPAGPSMLLAGKGTMLQAGDAAAYEVPTWQALLFAGLALAGGLAIGGGTAFLLLRKPAEAAEAAEDTGAPEAPGGAKEAEVAEAPAVVEAEAKPSPVDYERILRMVSQRVAQKFGPKLAKAQAVRGILEDHLTSVKAKARAFVLSELNNTAGAVLKAVDAEEAGLLLDWNNTVASGLPPLSLLCAGLLSPVLLWLRQLAAALQLALGLLPILALCAWAAIHDWGTVCAIPSIYLWVYVQGGLALVLTVASTAVLLQISSGRRLLIAKAEAVSARLKVVHVPSEEDTGISEMRELFVCISVLLQQALLIEDNVRKSFWHSIIGVGSVLWIVTMIWNFVIVLGWTFMPGDIAFHPNARFVAAEDYCGALVTVFAARMACVLQVLFLGMNIVSMFMWVTDVMTSTPAFGSGILKAAEKLDEGLLGIPVVQMLLKSTVLRGSLDLASSKLAVTMHEKGEVERERAKAQRRLDDLDAQLQVIAAGEKALKAKAADHAAADLESNIGWLESNRLTDLGDLQAKGSASIAQMQAQAAAVEEATTKEIEAMVQRVMEVADFVKDSDTFKSAAAQAQSAADLAQQHASAAAGQLTAENLQAAVAQARQVAEAGVSQAQVAAGQVQGAAMQVAGQVQGAAMQAAGQVQDAAGQLQDPEARRTLQESVTRSMGSWR